ncbi:MAG TPA: thiamine phosphate synthase [Phycisphaerales bacterium]|nr:thiamine phosphate synthase [Phycisphaerales bacterium]
MPPLARLIDANANRAREGLRVLEDLARFTLSEERLCAEIKDIRHALARALDALPIDRAVLLAWRDAAGDVGTTITGAGEADRPNLPSIAAAAAGRLAEALRSMEEAAKALAAPEAALAIERLRYRAYDAAAAVERALGTGRARQWRLCVLITESLCTYHAWERVAELAIDGGADCLQLREKSLDGAELLRRARRLVALARPRGVAVIINDRVDIALAAGADGVHLGQTDLPVRDARRIAGNSLLIGVSTSNLDQARAAARDGADSCGVGPMFPSATKPKALAGPEYLRQYLANPATARLPHLAISGITPDNISQLTAAGCRGIAVSSAVCSAPDPAAACRSILEALTAEDPQSR